QQSRLLEPLRVDLGEWKGWTELVRLAANEAVKRYDREYLVQVRYGAFSKALEQIVTLLRPAGALQPLAQGLELLCVPYRLLKSGWQRLFPASQAGAKDEDRCLDLV